MEKILLYLIVVVLLLSLTACGKKKDNTADPTPTSTSNTHYTTPIIHFDASDNGATGSDKEQANGNGGSGATKPDGQSNITLPDEWNGEESPIGNGEELPYMPID